MRAARDDFEAAHEAQFGFVLPDREIVVEAVEVEGTERRDERGTDAAEGAAARDRDRRGRHAARYSGRRAGTRRRFHRREALQAGDRIAGPAAHHRGEPDHRRRARLAAPS